MPQINRIRVNNVKYNFGTQYYDDFMMRFNCKNTIYDLANGGGKSLLMLLLLQNVIPNCTLDEKQPIEKLFRTGCDNTVIHSLVEWKLDACYRKDNYKYMTTGFCARKGHVRDEYAQEVESSDTVDISDSASIEYFNYCIFYRKFGDNDIKNIPLVKNGERVTYNGLKAYLRELEKNDFNVSVKIFDRKGDYQNFISRYGLFESEWEIIRGINKTEGHVRTYFETNYRTSRKVVEDLLIEEIIQKSFNNKLAVTDDEGKMAKTLLDIKDKLIELSKKNERISSYNSQMSALDDFAEYVSTFKAMYSKKEQLKKCLYNMLIKAHCMLITKDEYFTSVENEAESNRLSEEEEQRKIQTAQVMAEQYSLKSIEALIAENEKAREYDNNRLIQLQDKLRLMESANDYNDYIQYDKAMYEAQLAVNSVLRDNKEIIEELSVIAKAYKILYDTDIKKLEEELVTAKNKYEESGIKYAECNNNISEYEKKLAACESMSEYIASEIKEEEGQLAKLMGIAGLIVAENAQEEYDKNIDRIERIGHEQQNIKIQCDKKERKLSDIRYELSGIAALNKYLVNEYERQKQDKPDTDSVRQRIERLKKIYLTQNTESLVSVIHDTYDETYSELSKLKEKKERLKRFIVDTKDGRYSFDEPMINSLRKYLSLHYTGCFMQGHDWLKGYDDTTRVKLTEKYPFIEYAFIITDNFEKIGHDEVLKDFEKSAYMVPLVSSSIIDTLGDGNISNYNTTDDNIKPDNYIYDGLGYITFAGKNLSFLYDDARCNAQIKTAEEELDNVQENIEKLEDRCNILNEDYLFIIENNSSSFILEEQKLKDIAGKIQENKSREDKLKEEYENTKAAYNDELAEYNQLSEDFNSLNAANELLEKVIKHKERISSKYADLEQDKKSRAEYREALRELRNEAGNIHAVLEKQDILIENLHNRIQQLNKVWDMMKSIYDGNKECDISSYVNKNTQELESRFIGLKEALDKDNLDVSDKEALVKHYRQSMDKCKSQIEYRGSSFKDIEDKFSKGELSAVDAKELDKMKKVIEKLSHNIRQTDGQLDSQNALMNRLEGSIAHGVRQIEEKFGTFETFECDNIDNYIDRHKEYIKELNIKASDIKKKLKLAEKQMRKLSVIEKDLERIVTGAGMELPVYDMVKDTDISENIDDYEQVQKEFDKLSKLEFKKQDEFNKNRQKLVEKLESIDGIELASQIKLSVNIPENEQDTIELAQRLKETNTFIELEKERISKGIEDMEKIKDNFENRCIQTCSNIKTELDRLPKLSNITLDKEVISIISMYIPYIKEEQYKQKMSEYINETIITAESFKDTAGRLKYIRNRLAWKRLFSVIVTDMNLVRIDLYKRERIKSQSRYLRYEEAVGSTGQSQGIYIQFLISVINYISSINTKPSDSQVLGKTIFIDNPFGAAKDIYIWEPIFKLLKTNHVQLIVPARGATPAITGRFDVNYILGQKLSGQKQQTVVVDYYSRTDNDELEYTRMNYEQTTLKF